MWRRRYRTIHIARLDRLMAEAEAIGRAIAGGARWATVESTERITEPQSGDSVWAVVVAVSRTRHKDPCPPSEPR